MSVRSETRLEQYCLPVRGVTLWTFTLCDVDAERWDGERLDMVSDAFWLIRQAMQGGVEGPLTLLRLGVPLR